MSNPQPATGQKVFVDPAVLARIDATKPPAMSRTGWTNYLLQLGLAAAAKQPRG